MSLATAGVESTGTCGLQVSTASSKAFIREKVMLLRSFEYKEHVGSPEEWRIAPFTLGTTTLIVGRNASGKTRLLNVIHALARLLRSEHRLLNGEWSVTWARDNSTIQYDLTVRGGAVTEERYVQDMVVMLERNSDGTGTIRALAADEQELKFKISTDTLAAVAKRDQLQHPFLEDLHQWARYLRYYPFGTTMGRDVVAFFHENGKQPDPSNAAEVVGLFHKASRKFPKFEQGVIEDMHAIGYDLESIDVVPLENVLVQQSVPIAPQGLSVKEREVNPRVQQVAISQGMFRALSIVIHLRYAEAIDRASCILIDDIGEGLDFDRSARLIQLLMERAEREKVQLIMSTNDRFVMNAVPLESWAVLSRRGSTCSVFNFENARDRFEEFKLTGLNNFDLLRTNFLEAEGIAP